VKIRSRHGRCKGTGLDRAGQGRAGQIRVTARVEKIEQPESEKGSIVCLPK
jgi:hypothetical protein